MTDKSKETGERGKERSLDGGLQAASFATGVGKLYLNVLYEIDIICHIESTFAAGELVFSFLFAGHCGLWTERPWCVRVLWRRGRQPILKAPRLWPAPLLQQVPAMWQWCADICCTHGISIFHTFSHYLSIIIIVYNSIFSAYLLVHLCLMQLVHEDRTSAPGPGLLISR